MRNLLILIFCLFGLLVCADQVHSAGKPVDVNYEQECEKRFNVKQKDAKVKELQKKIANLNGKDQEIMRLKKQVENMNKELKEEKAKLTELLSQKAKEAGTFTETLSELERVKEELSTYKKSLSSAVWQKAKDVISCSTLEIGDFLSRVYTKTLQGPFTDRIFNGVKSTFSSLQAGASTLMESEFMQSLSRKTSDTVSSVSAYMQEKYTSVRNDSISALETNSSFKHLATEVIDLSLIGLMFLVFMLVVQPCLAFFVRVLACGMKKVLFFPFRKVKQA